MSRCTNDSYILLYISCDCCCLMSSVLFYIVTCMMLPGSNFNCVIESEISLVQLDTNCWFVQKETLELS